MSELSNGLLLAYIGVMALVTYLIRLLPLVLFTQKINNVFVRSFLYYVPYAVLGAMTVPAIFTSTTGPPTGTPAWGSSRPGRGAASVRLCPTRRPPQPTAPAAPPSRGFR